MTAELAPDRLDHSGPRVQIVRGHPTDAEVAALVAGLMVTAPPTPQPSWHRPSSWADRGRTLRTDLPHHPDAWRHSLRP